MRPKRGSNGCARSSYGETVFLLEMGNGKERKDSPDQIQVCLQSEKWNHEMIAGAPICCPRRRNM